MTLQLPELFNRNGKLIISHGNIREKCSEFIRAELSLKYFHWHSQLAVP